eukprot:m.9684 g.9684  ORF g.9684 m.9684 type:complete len:261 (-) comp7242_c0_seq1:200-982(-)
MKLNISFPSNGTQKTLEFENEHLVSSFFDKRMGQEVPADPLGDEWKGYVFRITGGNDKQGFSMKQGVLTNRRPKLLLSKGHSCYRPKKTGERKRKSVRGCIVDSQMSVISMAIVKKGEADIAGITDATRPRRLGPKRANNIRALFALDKKDDVRKYVNAYRRKIEKDGKVVRTKAPKIQRLITPQVLQRKRHRVALKHQRAEKQRELKSEYAKVLAKYQKEKREARAHAHERRRLSSTRQSESEETKKSPAKKGAKGSKK